MDVWRGWLGGGRGVAEHSKIMIGRVEVDRDVELIEDE